jgi:hypothetical protein
MTSRIPLDALTSDQLDQLYDRIDQLEHNAATDRQTDEFLDKQHAEIVDAARAFLVWGEGQRARAEQAEEQRDQAAAAVLRVVARWLASAHRVGYVNAGDLAWCLAQAGYPLPEDSETSPDQPPTGATGDGR